MTGVTKILRPGVRLLAQETFSIGVLVAVAIACGFAFLFEASGALIAVLLALGVATAAYEAAIRSRGPEA